MRRRDATRREAGFTIVEFAIVLAVSLLVLGAGLWSYSDSFKIDQDRGTRDYMDGVHDAIVSYAVSNRTIGSEAVFEASTATVTVSIPPGRPYLPCPDVDGDGFEDRNDQLQGFAAFTVAVTVNSGRYTALLDGAPGRCVEDRGFLPYRTLRTQGEDYWGNKYTYWVDLNFAHSSFGFDQSTRASRVLKHLATRNTVYVGSYDYVPHTRYSGATVGLYTSPRDILPAQGLILRNSTTDPSLTRVVAGEIFPIDLVRYSQAYEFRDIGEANGPRARVYEYRSLDIDYPYPDFDIRPDPFVANGIAFAVVSHGPNGKGAVKHRPHHSRGDNFRCERLDGTVAAEYLEYRNVRRNYDCRLSRRNQSGANLAESSGTFFVRERSGTVQAVYDDIVTWMKPDTLVSRLIDDSVLPVDLPPVAVL